jgi:hypothetical protein
MTTPPIKINLFSKHEQSDGGGNTVRPEPFDPAEPPQDLEQIEAEWQHYRTRFSGAWAQDMEDFAKSAPPAKPVSEVEKPYFNWPFLLIVLFSAGASLAAMWGVVLAMFAIFVYVGNFFQGGL